MSSDPAQALSILENALECLEALFSAVGAKDFLSRVRKWQGQLASGEKINANYLTFGKAYEINLPVRNRDQRTDVQLAWIEACFGYAAIIANGAAWFLWLHDRLIVKEPFAIASDESLKIRAMACARCHTVLVERKDVLEAAATAWGQFRVRPLIEAGKGQEAVEEALTCSLSTPFIFTIEEILREKGVERVQGKADLCPACGSAEIRHSPITLSWDSVGQTLRKRVV